MEAEENAAAAEKKAKAAERKAADAETAAAEAQKKQAGVEAELMRLVGENNRLIQAADYAHMTKTDLEILIDKLKEPLEKIGYEICQKQQNEK